MLREKISLQKIYRSFKASETLLGIETNLARCQAVRVARFKASETLLGIETEKDLNFFGLVAIASKPLKPF